MAGDVVRMRSDDQRRRVVVTFPLSVGAAGRLAEVLGGGFALVDIREAAGDEDVVLVPSSSRQLVGKMRDAFPDATLLVVEVEDAEHRVEFGGQVTRSLRAGADGYFVARSLDELAAIVGRASERTVEADTAAPASLAAGSSDDLESVLDTLLTEQRRERQRRR